MKPPGEDPTDFSGAKRRRAPTDHTPHVNKEPQSRETQAAQPVGPATKQCDVETLNNYVELSETPSNLAAAIAGTCGQVISLNEMVNEQFDVLKQEHYDQVKKLIKQRKVRWLHCVPPNASQAEVIARKHAQLARLQLKAGRFFNMEHPQASMLWHSEPVRVVRSLASVVTTEGDQCIGGDVYRRPTRWIGNAPWRINAQVSLSMPRTSLARTRQENIQRGSRQ